MWCLLHCCGTSNIGYCDSNNGNNDSNISAGGSSIGSGDSKIDNGCSFSDSSDKNLILVKITLVVVTALVWC